MVKISVIVPVHNGGTAFERCLESLLRADPAPEEIIIVADGESDGAWRCALDAPVRVVKSEFPSGPAHARNRGAAAARGDVFMFVDADVAIQPDTIALVAGVLDSSDEVDALIGSYDDSPAEPDVVSQYRNLLHHYTHQTSREDACTFWGACGAIRREAFAAVGGFDERYGKPSIEDIDLGYRLKNAGYEIRLCKDIQVKHLKRWRPLNLMRADFFHRGIPWTQLLVRERRLDSDLNLRTSNRFSVAAAFGLVISLVVAPAAVEFLFIAAAAALSLLVINVPFYLLVRQKRGLVAGACAIPWHWLHLLCGGAAFLVALIGHVVAPATVERGYARSGARPMGTHD